MRVVDHVVERLAVADHRRLGTVHQYLGGTQTAVILVAHAESVRAGILHYDEVAGPQAGGQAAFLDPVVGVFAELAAEPHGLAQTRPITYPALPTK